MTSTLISVMYIIILLLNICVLLQKGTQQDIQCHCSPSLRDIMQNNTALKQNSTSSDLEKEHWNCPKSISNWGLKPLTKTLKPFPFSKKTVILKWRNKIRGVKISEADSESVFQTPTTIEDRKEQDTKLLSHTNVEDFVIHRHYHWV